MCYITYDVSRSDGKVIRTGYRMSTHNIFIYWPTSHNIIHGSRKLSKNFVYIGYSRAWINFWYMYVFITKSINTVESITNRLPVTLFFVFAFLSSMYLYNIHPLYAFILYLLPQINGLAPSMLNLVYMFHANAVCQNCMIAYGCLWKKFLRKKKLNTHKHIHVCYTNL